MAYFFADVRPDKVNLPVKFIGLGEQVDDLQFEDDEEGEESIYLFLNKLLTQILKENELLVEDPDKEVTITRRAADWFSEKMFEGVEQV